MKSKGSNKKQYQGPNSQVFMKEGLVETSILAERCGDTGSVLALTQ